VRVELMAIGMGRQTGKLSRKLLSSAIGRRVTLCGLFYDAGSVRELHDIYEKKIVMVTWDVAVIQLLYYPLCLLEGLRNAATVLGAEHCFFSNLH
jgi:hypothetical protein